MITFNTEQVTKNTTSKDLEALSSGCPEVKLQEKSVEYTQNAEYEVVPDKGYDGLSKVNVSVDLVVPTVQNSKSVEITSNGETTIKPDSDYDVVEQVIVTTNVDVTTPYNNGVADGKQLQAAEDLAKLTTENITANGTYKAEYGYSSVTVNVPKEDFKTQEKTVTQNGEVTPDAGFDGLSKVTVDVDLETPYNQGIADQKAKLTDIEITQNGTYTRSDGYKQVDVNIPLQEKSVNVLLSDTSTEVLPDAGYEGITKLTVTHSPVESNTAYEATSNGNYTITPSEGYDATTSVNLTVNVPEAKLQDEKSIIITENGDTNIEPDETFDAIKKVVVTTNVDLQTPYNNGYSAGKQDQATEDQNKLTTKDITANGSYTADYGFSSVNVNVPSTQVEPTKQVTITSNGVTNVIPDDGYDCIEGVDITVNVPSKEEETKSVSYTSNGSYTVQPTEGKTLSEVSVNVNVTNPPTVYDISNKYVSLAGGTITSAVINELVGWDTVQDGSYKLGYATWTGGNYVFPDGSFQALQIGNYMFASPNGDNTFKSPDEYPELLYGGHMFYGSLSFYSDNPVSFPKLKSGSYMFAALRSQDRLRANVLASDFPELTDGEGMFYINETEEGSYNFPKLTRANDLILGGKILTLTFGAESIIASHLIDGRSSLTALTIHNPNSTFDSRLATIYPGFITCKNEIDFNIDKIDFSVRLSDAMFTQSAVNNIMNALQDASSSPKTITFSSTSYAYITDEQKEAATAKGWTINQA